MGHSPKFLEHLVVLCFDRRYAKQNSVNSSPPKFWPGNATGFIE